MDNLQKFAANLSTRALQATLQGLNDEADALEQGGHDVTDIENEIRVMEEELESR